MVAWEAMKLYPINVIDFQDMFPTESALALKGILGFGSYKTAWEWLHKLRRAMVRPGRDRLSGTIEVDEVLIGGPKTGKMGRNAFKKALVLVAVEDKGKDIGRIRLAHIKDASHASIIRALKTMVEPGESTAVKLVVSSGYPYQAI